MKFPPAVLALDEALTELATLYQFRSLEEPVYDGLTVSQSYVLRVLYFHGSRAMGDLASELRVRVSTMTGIVDQLERKQLVGRVDHPDDRRSLQVQLTGAGRRLYRSAHEAFLSELLPLVKGRSDAECKKVLSFLADVTRAIHAWRDRTAAKAPESRADETNRSR